MNFQSDHTSNKRVSFLTQSNAKIKITYPIPVVGPDNDHAGIVELQKTKHQYISKVLFGRNVAQKNRHKG